MLADKYREALIAAGFEDQADSLVASIKPSIRLRTEQVSQDDLPMGASRLGGMPDLYPQAKWPGALAFIGQINLSEIASYEAASLLPPSGWLYFFFDADEQPPGY